MISTIQETFLDAVTETETDKECLVFQGKALERQLTSAFCRIKFLEIELETEKNKSEENDLEARENLLRLETEIIGLQNAAPQKDLTRLPEKDCASSVMSELDLPNDVACKRSTSLTDLPAVAQLLVSSNLLRAKSATSLMSHSEGNNMMSRTKNHGSRLTSYTPSNRHATGDFENKSELHTATDVLYREKETR